MVNLTGQIKKDSDKRIPTLLPPKPGGLLLPHPRLKSKQARCSPLTGRRLKLRLLWPDGMGLIAVVGACSGLGARPHVRLGEREPGSVGI